MFSQKQCRSLVIAVLAIACRVFVFGLGAGAEEPGALNPPDGPREQSRRLLVEARDILAKATPPQDRSQLHDLPWIWTSVVEAQIEAGDLAAAKLTVSKVPEALYFYRDMVPRPYGARDAGLYLVARAELDRNDLEAALQTVTQIKYERPGTPNVLVTVEPDRRAVLRRIVEKHIAERRYKEAEAAVRHLVARSAQAADRQLLNALLTALSADGRAADGIRLANEHIPAGEARDNAMRAIALGLTRAGQVTAAKKWAGQVLQPLSMLSLLGQMADVQAKHGDFPGAAQSFREAEALANLTKGEDRAIRLVELYESLARAACYAEALRIVAVAEKIIPGHWSTNPRPDLCEIAVQAGDFEDAKTIARTFKSEEAATGALVRIAGLQAEHDDDEAALESLEEAWKIASPWREKTGQIDRQVQILEAMSPRWSGGGLGEKVEHAFESSQAVEAHPPKAPDDAGWAQTCGQCQARLAGLQARHGSAEKALAEAGAIADLPSRSLAYEQIALAQARAQDSAGALKTYALMVRGEGYGKAGLDLVRAFARRGQYEPATEVVRRLNPGDGHERAFWLQAVKTLVGGFVDGGEFAAARTFLHGLGDAYPEPICEGFVDIACACVKAGRRGEAEADVVAAEVLAPRLNRTAGSSAGSTLVGIAVLMRELGDEEAARRFSKAFNLEGEGAVEMFDLHLRVTNPNEMAKLRAYYESLQSPPEQVRARVAIARALLGAR